MKRSAAVALAALSLLLAGLAIGMSDVRAGDHEGEGDERDVDRKTERRVEVVRLGGEGRAFLGVRLDDVEGDARGARVRSVEPESPAEKAGLQDGDVIVRFDGADVRSALQLARVVRETPAGREVDIEVERDGATRTLSATLAEGPGLPHARNASSWLHAGPGEWVVPDLEHFDIEVQPPLPRGAEPHVFRWHRDDDGDFTVFLGSGRPRLGIRFIEIEGQLADYFGLAADTGVLVSSVDKDSPAAKAGFQAGDVVLELGGQAIRNGGDLRRAIRDVEGGGPVTVKLQRDGKPLEVEAVLPEPETPAKRIHRRATQI